MNISIISIGRAAFAALALALVAVACDDDASPTKLADDDREPETTVVNPWTQILAAAGTLGGPVKITFAGSDRSYRVRELDPEPELSQNVEVLPTAVCTVEDAANRADLDAFRQCMARALRADVCRSGGVFVLQRDPHVANTWRTICPAPGQEEDDPEDDESRVNEPA